MTHSSNSCWWLTIWLKLYLYFSSVLFFSAVYESFRFNSDFRWYYEYDCRWIWYVFVERFRQVDNIFVNCLLLADLHITLQYFWIINISELLIISLLNDQFRSCSNQTTTTSTWLIIRDSQPIDGAKRNATPHSTSLDHSSPSWTSVFVAKALILLTAVHDGEQRAWVSLYKTVSVFGIGWAIIEKSQLEGEWNNPYSTAICSWPQAD